jgi:hypothetical protein
MTRAWRAHRDCFRVRDSILIVEIFDGPYRGHIVRIGGCGRFLQVKSRFGDDPLERYERFDLGAATSGSVTCVPGTHAVMF